MAPTDSTGNSTPQAMPCENCGRLTRLNCSRCRSVPVCTRECLAAIWKMHKPECKNIVETQQLVIEQMQATAADAVMQPVLAISAEDYHAISQRALDVFHRHNLSGVPPPPPKGSTADSHKKLALYLDMLRAHYTSSGANRDLPQNMQFLLNRRYNNTYRHAIENLSHGENAMMLANRVSAAYQ